MSEDENDVEPEFQWELEEPIAVLSRDIEKLAAAGKIPWEERSRRISAMFPSVDKVDWTDALERDINLFGRIVRDILKLEQAVPGRPGPRPSLDQYAAIRRMHQLWGHDFSISPFPEAFRVLQGDRSIRALGHKVHLDRNTVYRLLTGQIEPDGYHMRMCAEAFGKHPSYFLEWRVLYIVAALVRRLEWSPETTVDIFRTLDFQRKRAAS